MANGFGSLHVGASGIQGAQNGLNVIANNISNVDTTGYVRQQVVYEDRSYLKVGMDAAISKQQAGIGVAIGDVAHTRDMFLDSAYRTENGRQEFYQASYDAAYEVETLLNESNGTLGMAFKAAIEDLDDAFNEFATTPADGVSQNMIIQKADLFLSRAIGVYDGMTNYQRNINKQISDDIDKINELGKNIFELNLKIQKIEAAGVETAMDLRDARDQALDELSGLANISYKETVDGIVKVKLEGTDFVIESRKYDIEKLVDQQNGFVTPYWDVLSDPVHNDYYKVFDTTGIDPNKNNDVGEVKAMLLARGEDAATFMDMLAVDYTKKISVDKVGMLGSYEYEHGIANCIMMNEECEFDMMVHNLVTAVNNLLSPITDYKATAEGASMVTKHTEVDPGTGRKEEVYDKNFITDEDTPLTDVNDVRFYDPVYKTYLKGKDVEGLIIFDEENACVGVDGQMPPRELFSRIGCDRYRVVTVEYVVTDEDGQPVYRKDESGNDVLLTAKKGMYVYNEEGMPKLYDAVDRIYKADTGTCYTLKSLSINKDLMRQPSLIAHRYKSPNPNDDAIAYDLGRRIYATWLANDYQLNPSDETPCSFHDFYGKMVSELATVESVYKTMSESLDSTRQSIENNRQAVIGVSTDEELQTMIKFQNAYNASSRYMNVVSEMIQTLISSMGA